MRSFEGYQRDEDLFFRMHGSIGKSRRNIQFGIVEADTISRRDTDTCKDRFRQIWHDVKLRECVYSRAREHVRYAKMCVRMK